MKVLDVIRLGVASSQSDIARMTGLGRTAVGQRVSELQAAGIVDAEGTVLRVRGRPARRLRLRPDAGHLFVAALGATSAVVAITDLTGAILVSKEAPIAIADGPEKVLADVCAIFGELQATDCEFGPLWAIGIGVPGPVEFETGRPVAPPIMPGWDRYDIPGALARYDVPVWVDNDVNVMALGESHEGTARGAENVVYVKIGTGIGAGIIIDGSLCRGAQGAAGDVGHIPITDDPDVICRCGNIGCLEALASGWALGREAERVALAGRSRWLATVLDRSSVLTAADVAEAASHGDPVATEMLQRAGRRVGTMLAGVVNLLNPSLVVIGGGVARSGDGLLAAIRESVYRRSLPLATRHLLVTRSSLDQRAGVIGTAAMVLDELFSETNLTNTLNRATRRTQASPKGARPMEVPLQLG